MTKASVPAELLARTVHTWWRRDREALGWSYGPHDRALRRSPYIKQFEAFSPIEHRREMWLAIGDLLGLAAALGAYRGGLTVDRQSLLQSLTELTTREADAALTRAAALVHESWRRTNVRLGFAAGDPRLDAPFSQLALADQELTMSNVRADVMALQEFLSAASAATISIDIPPALLDAGLLEGIQKLAAEAARAFHKQRAGQF